MTHSAEQRRIAHRHDPASSHLAAERIVQSGKAKTHRDLVLAALREHPGSTAGEVAELTELSPVEVRRRLTDAKNAGQAWQGYTRTCGAEGTTQSEWWTADDAMQGSLL